MSYEGAISTMPGKDKWETDSNDIFFGAPYTSKPRGRPKKNRFKSFMEQNNSKEKSAHRCSSCGEWGHHRNTCKNPINDNNTSSSQYMRDKIPFRTEQIEDDEYEEHLASHDF